MSRSRHGKGAIGVLASALLLSGLFVGVSRAGGDGITEPTVIELTTPGCRDLDDCPLYRLRDSEGELTGVLRRFRDALSDVDGDPVGWSYRECFGAKRTGTICTHVLVLMPGPHTERGTITAAGVYHGPPTTFAVTGGTGAYRNVRGELTGTEGAGGFVFTLSLTT
jgi:hypothetical protein